MDESAGLTFHASISSPIPEPNRIIQLVSVLLSMRYKRITSWTKTFVIIFTIKVPRHAWNAVERTETYRPA